MKLLRRENIASN